VDRDGDVDVLVAAAGYTMQLAGDGAGGLTPGVRIDALDSSTLQSLEDVDGDGWIDALGVRADFEDPFGSLPPTPGAVTLAYGNGAGGWIAPVELDSGSFRWAQVADFDADGRVDIAAWESTTDSFHVLLGRPGGFAPVRVFAAGAEVAVEPVLGDFDGDGALDLAFLSPGDTGWPASASQRIVTVLLGDGAGGFAGRLATPTPLATTLAAADLDGDGVAELVTHSDAHAATRATIHRYQGGGLFDRHDLQGAVRPPFFFADVDADGDADLLASDGCGLVLRRNAGAGALDDVERIWSAESAQVWTAADLDGDGFLDPIVGRLRGDVCVTYSNAQGRYEWVAPIPFARHELDSVTGDIDQDGLTDVVEVFVDHFETHVGLGGGLYAQRSRVGVSRRYETPQLKDIDGDGDLDLFATYSDLQTVLVVHRNDGAGNFALLPTETVVSASPSLTGDFDGDGRCDVLQYGANLALLLSDGLGGFQAPVTTPLLSGMGSPVVGDFDGDGVDDIVVSLANAIAFYRGTSSGVFAGPLLTPTPNPDRIEATGDFDGDGRVDVAAVDPYANRIAIGFGDGAGGFGGFTSTYFDFTGPFHQASLHALRFDGDGLDDLAIFEPGDSYWPANLSVIHSLGVVGFGRPQRVLISEYAATVQFADMDSDGRAEVVVGSGCRRGGVLGER